MARSFLATSTQYLESASVPVTGWPMSMACWFRVPNVTANHTLFFLSKSTGVGYIGLSCRGDLAGDYLEAYVDNGTPSIATSASSCSANTWHHALLVRASDTSLVVYLDGGNSGSSAASKSWASVAPTHTQIGIVWYKGSRVGPLTGDIAHAGIWSAALTSNDAESLSMGRRHPRMVRPDALVSCWDLGGFAGENDRDNVGGYHLTATGSPTFEVSPPVWYPGGPRIVVPGGGAPAAAGSPWNYYAQQA